MDPAPHPDAPAPVDLAAACARLDEPWSPRVVAALNDDRFKVARLEGAFVEHAHPDTDEAFLVLDGRLTIELEDGAAVELGPGQLYVVPRGVRHRPVAHGACHVLLVEPAGVVNTGDSGAEGAPVDRWLDPAP